MKNKLILFFTGVLLLTLVGCSGNIKVSGTVKYTDGSPLTLGTVIFGNGNDQYQGDIKKDGTFRIEGINAGNGIPKGQYKVWLSNTTIVEYSKKKVDFGEAVNDERFETVHVAPQFNSAETSGFSADVDTSRTTFNFVVEHP